MQISIIGAGLGGLAAACLLAKKSHQVTVFEKNSNVGGKMSQVMADGYRFDTGPSLLTMPQLLEDVFLRCGAKLEDYIEIVSLDPICRYIYPDGTRLDSFSDPAKSLQAIRAISAADESNYLNFLKYASSLFDKTAPSFLYNPLQSLSDLKGINLSDMLSIDAFKSTDVQAVFNL